MTGADKATFGFTVQCRDTREKGTPVAVISNGELDWNDGYVSFHGIVEPMTFTRQICDNITLLPDFRTITFYGTYTSQPPGAIQPPGASGMFTATVYDGGEPGSISGDFIEIDLTGGYSNAGPIQQGNIQVF